MQTDERILAAAAVLFRQRGFPAVGVAEIGAAAGVSGPAIYKHFASKDEILGSLFERAMERLLGRLEVSEGDPWEQLDALVDAMVDFGVTERDLVLVYVQERRFLVDPWRRSVRRQISAHLERWQAVVGGCRPDLVDAEVRAIAWALNEMLLSLASWSRDARAAARSGRLLRELARGALHGLGGGPGSTLGELSVGGARSSLRVGHGQTGGDAEARYS